MKRLIPMLLACLACTALAEVKPFESGTLARIRAAREGRPFILSFWSTDCAHCPKELAALGELKRRYPKLDIVMVATDTSVEGSVLAEVAQRNGLGQAEQWAFATEAQRLRYEVDSRWWGELPRTYFHDAAHRVEAVSGIVPDDVLARWARTATR